MTDFIKWTDKLTLGIQEVDDQHLRMFRVLERLAGAARQSAASPSLVTASGAPEVEVQPDQSIPQLLDELVEKTQEHFRSEEGLMVEHCYPDLNEHRREHTMLIAELKSFVRDITKGAASLDQKTLCALKQWLIVHICESDRAFADYVRASENQA